jgi:hypothetical protein
MIRRSHVAAGLDAARHTLEGVKAKADVKVRAGVLQELKELPLGRG